MTKLPLYQVDAFSDQLFCGNPAAVCPLEDWLPESLMQSIAQENNLSETAFFVKDGEGIRLRWFTPLHEVKLCGHATLASAHVLFHHLAYPGELIRFHTLSGQLTVQRVGDRLVMDLPADKPDKVPLPDALSAGIGTQPREILAGMDYIAVLDHADMVRDLRPDFTHLMTLDRRGVMVTAPGKDCDFVCRFFAPRYGINEDPVTGSAYCQLTPYWAHRLGKKHLLARQLSARGGVIGCELLGDRVLLSGSCVTYLEAAVHIPR